MKVFKFGGASINSVERIKQLPQLLNSYQGEQLLIIVSAMGKTTNALEKVAESFYASRKEEALGLFETIKQNHLTTAKYLLVTHYNAALAQLTDLFTEVEWLLHDSPQRAYDYYYDQIVCIGELLSTVIVSAYFNESGLGCHWIDVRDILRTDNNYRDAAIDWDYTQKQVTKTLHPLLQKHGMVLTQGFIGATDENESTTLGREGSDYTAAIFANLLDAESQTLWKDVPGVMSADPRLFPNASLLEQLSYDEAIKMTYYGAQVIHPKTIKPLENKNIPLYVKCFLDVEATGTLITHQTPTHLPPIIVLKKDQVLIHLHSKDLSFVGEKAMATLYEHLSDIKLRPNLLQTGAVTIRLCIDDIPDKTERLAFATADLFDVQLEKGLQLLTIRHYAGNLFETLLAGRHAELIQQSPDVIQALVREPLA